MQESDLAASAGSSPKSFSSSERVERLQLSSHQQRLWFIDQLDPGAPLYNVAWGFHLDGRLNHDALRRGLDAIVARHEPIRTRILVEDGIPMQIVDAPRPAPFRVVDLSSHPKSERDWELDRYLTEEPRRSFDISRDVMLRALLVRLSADEHVLVLTMHHIATDAWSMSVLCRELSAIYAAEIAETSPVLPPLPLTYSDFCAWQQKQLEGERFERDLAYWKNHLSGLVPLELPTDRPVPARVSYAGGQQRLALTRTLTDRLKAVGRGERATLFMAIMTGFQALLMRYTGQQDLAIGTPTAGRVRTDVNGLIGYFADTVVLRSDLSGEPSFRELLRRVREVALEAFSRQGVPFESLVAALNPERKVGDNPLFQVMFSFYNAEKALLDLEGITASEIPVQATAARFHLELKLSERKDGLRGSIVYRSELFDAATIERLACHFEALLEAAAADPDLPISRLPILTEDERRTILLKWNATERDYPSDRGAHELFEEQVTRNPEAVAIRDERRSMTYAELNRRANELACHLRDLGVEPDQVVGIFLERSLEVGVAALGILKSGGAMLPLDPDLPRARLSFMLADSKADVVVTTSSLSDGLADYAGRIVSLDVRRPDGAEPIGHNPPPRSSGRSLAYVIFTSGSTGKPKGVLIEHRSLTNYLCDLRERFALGPGDVFLHVTSFGFDISIQDLFGPLTAGAQVVIVERGTLLDPARLGAAMLRHGATVMDATPATWQMLLDAGWSADGNLTRLSAGEALSAGIAERLLRSPGRLWNLYGPTETTIISSAARIDPGEPVTIGRPVSNTQIYVLDPHLQPVPVGVRGTLYIGGDGLARGYLNQPALTADRFIPDPFRSDPGARLYDTGDRASYLPDGRIVFHGRVDQQIKIRGHRIEPAEIEAVLLNHASVRAAAVVSQGEGLKKRLIAFVIASDGCQVVPAELRTHLRQQLPDYMVPARFVAQDVFPLTQSGKLDRNALSERVVADDVSLEESSRPFSPVETALTTIWSEVLDVEQPRLDDDFFDLGGHSLMAVQILARIRDSLGVDLPLRSIFDAPTIAALAELVEVQGSLGDGQGPEQQASSFFGRDA